MSEESSPDVSPWSGPRHLFRFFHLLALSSFALLPPVVDVVAEEPQFWIVRRIDWLELAFLLGMFLLVPLALFAAEWLLTQISRWMGPVFHILATTALWGLVLLPILDRLTGSNRRGSVVMGLAVAMALAAALAVWRFRPIQAWLSLLALAPMVIVGLVVADLPRLGDYRGTLPDPGITNRNVSVVMLVLDEFNPHGLVGPDGEIDAELYPNFARLAASSTYYPNAFSVDESTIYAVTSILTGRRPLYELLASSQYHPINLFTLLAPSHRVVGSEEITRLCPTHICRPAHGTRARARRELLSDLAVIWLHGVAPTTLRHRLPPIGFAWKGFAVESPPDTSSASSRALYDLTGGESRATNFGQFLDSFQDHEAPSLYFHHIELPHVEYEYLADGARYTHANWFGGLDETGKWATQPSFVAQAYQRYRVQLRFTDHLVGLMLNALEQSGLWNASMVVVLADHGINFGPGEATRDATPDTVGSLAPVPLFIRYPGQQSGTVDDRYATILDVLPTVLDVLGATDPPEMHGASLLQPPAFSGSEVINFSGVKMTLDEIRERARQDDEFLDLLPGRLSAESWESAGPRGDIIGLDVGATTRRETDRSASLLDPEVYVHPTTDPYPKPNLVRAHVNVEDGTVLALSVNDVIVDTSLSFRGEVYFFVPPEAWDLANNVVGIHLVWEDGDLALSDLGTWS